MQYKISTGPTADYSQGEVDQALASLKEEQRAPKNPQHGRMCDMWTRATPQKSMHAECGNCGISELLHAMAGRHPNHDGRAEREAAKAEETARIKAEAREEARAELEAEQAAARASAKAEAKADLARKGAQ